MLWRNASIWFPGEALNQGCIYMACGSYVSSVFIVEVQISRQSEGRGEGRQGMVCAFF